MRHLRLLFVPCLVAGLALLFALPPAPAETCLSPFVKRIDRPEKYLYVFCVDADAKDNDFLAVTALTRHCSSLFHDRAPRQYAAGISRFLARSHRWDCSQMKLPPEWTASLCP